MGTVLLIDDNSLRASMRVSNLEGTVTAVVRVADAAEALCLAEDAKFAGVLSLVILVPFSSNGSQITALELAEELTSRLRRIPVLVLGGPMSAEADYQKIAGVYWTQTKSPQELRATVLGLMGMDERRTA